MPELPEVETIARVLREGVTVQGYSHGTPSLQGRMILKAQLLWARTLAVPTPAEFAARIAGQRIVSIGRRGKFLVFELSHGAMLIHLRMSGDLWVEPADSPVGLHHRLLLELDGGMRLVFHDPRKFGRVWLVEDPADVLGDLGPEPLDPELTAEDLYSRLQAHRRQLKPLLLDQRFLAGLGNIYADEALFASQLHPLTHSNRVTPDQAGRLLEAIRLVLEEGIRRNGASIDWVYRGGDFQNHFQVYQRTGEPCYRCGTPIQRQVIGQRSTHLCPSCQPEIW